MTETPAFLKPIVTAVRHRLAERREVLPIELLRDAVKETPKRRELFRSAIGGEALSIIAEHKRRSPSKGVLSRRDLEAQLSLYDEGGADAFSILTETDHFDGSLDDLRTACDLGRPCLRKDFVLEESMVLEAAEAGACAVLLLACIHDAEPLAQLTSVAHRVGLAVLLEVHDETELERAIAAGPDAIGVNARDLHTFEVSLDTVVSLLPKIPDGTLRVAESGIHTPEDAARVRAAGADAVLIGEALMRSDEPDSMLRALKSTSR